MKPTNSTQAAKAFAEFWSGRGDEKQDTASFWMGLLRTVLGVGSPETYIKFEKPVQLKHTSYIDAYIPATKVAIEQKGFNKDLSKPYVQSDGTMLTPYQQGKRYTDELPYSQRPRWIVTCNFQEFWVYDLEHPHTEPERILLKDLEKDWYRLQFLVDDRNEHLKRELEVSVKACELVGKIYDALIEQYVDKTSPETLHSLNVLCVRLVFCLYAEDAGLFGSKTAFHDYLAAFPANHFRRALTDLFETLNTPVETRNPYTDEVLMAFPYVNGGLFGLSTVETQSFASLQKGSPSASDIEIPNFSDDLRTLILDKASTNFDWSEISPTIFGSLFESTLNPDMRRKGGMHYTSIENIHKVIDPLFMDELEEEYRGIVETHHGTSLQKQNRKLLDFQNKLASLTFLDPACGSGNFLTESYMSLRRLENRVITEMTKGQSLMGFEEMNPVKVSINQFYGIEINDFAVDVAKTALWIAENQMLQETERIIDREIDPLPLKSYANIRKGNALRMDWSTLEELPSFKALYTEKLNVYKVRDFEDVPQNVEDSAMPYNGVSKELNVVTKKLEMKELPKTEINPMTYDYIIGNPPFSGARMMGKEQKEDVQITFGKNWKGLGDLDYVTCWYKKASDFITGTKTRCALLSTNSVSQGSTVTNLWKPLFADGVHIDFAWRTFRWENETTDKKNMAAVHCVVIGFSEADNPKQKVIYMDNENRIEAANINGYLMDMPNVFIENRKKPLCDVPEMVFGSMPNDGGNLIIEADEYADFVNNEAASEKYIRPFIGSDEFINGKKRYCLWLKEASPAELRGMPLVAERVRAVRLLRSASTRPSTKKLADTPHLFGEIRQPDNGNFLLIPRVSSENRIYIPVGFVDSHTIASDATLLIPNASLYEFGIMMSHAHNAWMRAVCGRLKSDFRYSASIVYNNFPWPFSIYSVQCTMYNELFDKQKLLIEQTAQSILDIRAKYSDSTLADLYDDNFMPADLRAAHRANDRAVMQAYGFGENLSEEEIVAELFKMYEKLVETHHGTSPQQTTNH